MERHRIFPYTTAHLGCQFGIWSHRSHVAVSCEASGIINPWLCEKPKETDDPLPAMIVSWFSTFSRRVRLDIQSVSFPYRSFLAACDIKVLSSLSFRHKIITGPSNRLSRNNLSGFNLTMKLCWTFYFFISLLVSPTMLVFSRGRQWTLFQPPRSLPRSLKL